MRTVIDGPAGAAPRLLIVSSKAHAPALDRAATRFDEMLGHVDELGELISEARAKQRATDDIAA